MHWQTLIDSVFHILNISNEPLNHHMEKECKATLSAFFNKIGIYECNLLDSIDDAEKEFNSKLLDKVLVNLYQAK